MKRSCIVILVILSAVLVFTACSKSKTENSKSFSCAGVSSQFSANVQPILTTICSINSNCHAAGSTNTGGALTNYGEVNAKRIEIRAAILSGTMPQSGSLTQAQINAFICWIDSGAPNN